MDSIAIVLQGASLAAICWLFRSAHLILVQLARMQEHLDGQDRAIARLEAARRSNAGR